MIRLLPLAGITLVALIARFAIPIPEGLDARSWSLLILFLAALAGLILQPAPMGVVFLSAITVGTLTGVLTPSQALAGYSNNILWLIVVAFMFARAFVKTALGRRIALSTIRRIGGSSLRLGYALSLTDLVLAPAVVSNTARAGAIVFPIAVSLSRELGSHPGPTASRIGSFLLFTAYQANLVTSALFLTAMASNPLATEFARQVVGVRITWTSWLAASIVFPAVVLLFQPQFDIDALQRRRRADLLRLRLHRSGVLVAHRLRPLGAASRRLARHRLALVEVARHLVSRSVRRDQRSRSVIGQAQGDPVMARINTSTGRHLIHTIVQ